MRRHALMLLLALCMSANALAAARVRAPEDFALDPVHTRVLVAVEHAGFSRALGTVSGATGHLRFGEGWQDASVDVRVPLGRLDFGDVGWNAAVQRLLESTKFPEARFTSTRITPRDAAHAEACGQLTLHGVTGPACLDVALNALKRHPMPPFRRTAGFSATAHIDRTAFGITQWKTVIGSDIELRFEVEATRAGAATELTEPPPVDTAVPVP